MKLFNVKISAKNFVITFVAPVFFLWLLCFHLAVAVPSFFGMFIYKAFSSMVTKNEFFGTLKFLLLKDEGDVQQL